MKNKGNILFIAPSFNNYYKYIMKSFEDNGFNVFYEKDQFNNSTLSFIFKKIDRKYVKRNTDRYIRCIINRYSFKKIDKVIIILAYTFSKENIISLRNAFKGAEFVYYAWDSIQNFPVISNFVHIFDRSYSFDMLDCVKYGMDFLPLFYLDKRMKKQEKMYDYSIIMTVYPTKVKKLKDVLSLLPKDVTAFKYLLIKSKLFYFYFKIFYFRLFKDFKMKDFKFKKISLDKTHEIFASSRAVIDIPLDNQHGLTMRTFEALSLGCKLVTTNKYIKNYDFYNKRNVFIFGEDSNFGDFLKYDFDINYLPSEKYKIDSFSKTLLG